MLATEKSTQRVIGAIALLVIAVWALRGYLPGVDRAAERDRPESNPAALVVVVAMVSTAVAIIGFAIVMRMRDRKPRAQAAGELPRRLGPGGRPSWRFTLTALGFIIAWLLLVVMLTSVGGQRPTGQPTSLPPATQDTGDGQPADEAPRPADTDEPETDVVGYLIPPMLVLMALVVVGSTVAARRQRRDRPPPPIADVVDAPPPPAATDSLARAAEVGLAAIEDLSREPREAIIACYAAMERELMRVPGAVPQDCDTPSEVLARAVRGGALRADSATDLVDLFEEARFSPHVMTESHRDVAVRVLQRVVAELPDRVGGAS